MTIGNLLLNTIRMIFNFLIMGSVTEIVRDFPLKLRKKRRCWLNSEIAKVSEKTTPVHPKIIMPTLTNVETEIKKWSGDDYQQFCVYPCAPWPRVHLHAFDTILSTFCMCDRFETCLRIFCALLAECPWSMFSMLSSRNEAYGPGSGSWQCVR